MTGAAFDALNPACPSRVILSRIGDKWTLMVIAALSREVLRFSQLRDRIGGVTPKVLTQTLRSLEKDGLIRREIFPVIPPKVEYRLTDLGQSLLDPIAAIREWAQTHVGEVLASRERAEAAELARTGFGPI